MQLVSSSCSAAASSLLFVPTCRDFTIKMAAALQENPSSALQSLHLSGNVIEDRGESSEVLLSIHTHTHSSGGFRKLLSPRSGVMALCQELLKLPEGLKHLSLSRVSMTGRGNTHTHRQVECVCVC